MRVSGILQSTLHKSTHLLPTNILWRQYGYIAHRWENLNTQRSDNSPKVTSWPWMWLNQKLNPVSLAPEYLLPNSTIVTLNSVYFSSTEIFIWELGKALFNVNNYINDQDHKILLCPKEIPQEHSLNPESSKNQKYLQPSMHQIPFKNSDWYSVTSRMNFENIKYIISFNHTLLFKNFRSYAFSILHIFYFSHLNHKSNTNF